MSEADLADHTWWAWLWGEIEHWAFLAVVVALAIEFAALKLAAPHKEALDHARELKIAQLTEDAARLSVEAENAKAEIAKANEAAEKARLEQERLRAQLAWRRLTQDQYNHFVGVLRTAPAKISVVNPNEAEAQNFANDLTRAFRAAGWEVAQGTNVVAGPVQVGLMLHQLSSTVPHLVATALTQIGFDVVVYHGVPDDKLQLVVGVKPPPK